MKRRDFLGTLGVLVSVPFIDAESSIKVKSPLFYQVKIPTFLVYYTIEGKGVESSLQQRSFVVQTFKVKTSFKEWIDTMKKDNHVVVYDWWVQEAPTAPFESFVIIRAALLNKSIPYVMSEFEPRFDYTLLKNNYLQR